MLLSSQHSEVEAGRMLGEPGRFGYVVSSRPASAIQWDLPREGKKIKKWVNSADFLTRQCDLACM